MVRPSELPLLTSYLWFNVLLEVRSKRQPVRLRHKIEKRGNEKKRKERRHEKKHPELYHKKKPAVLNIPNSFPYKDRLLAEIEEGRRLRKEEQEKRKEDARQRRKELASSVDGGEDAMYDVDAISDSASGDEGSDTMDTDEEQVRISVQVLVIRADCSRMAAIRQWLHSLLLPAQERLSMRESTATQVTRIWTITTRSGGARKR